MAEELRPITETKPSTLLPILNVPIFKRLIEALPEEVEEVMVAAGFGGKKIEEYVEDQKFSVPISVVREKRPLGTAGAIKSFESLLSETFLAINADIVTTMQISPMIEAHKDSGAQITCALHDVRRPFNFGIFGLDEDNRVIRYMEKPKPDQVFSTLINAGIYVIEPSLLELIPSRSHSTLPDLFTRLVRKNADFYGYPFKEYWAEIGTPKKYLRAHVQLLNRSMEFDVKKASVAKRARLMPPIISESGTRISPSIIGPEVTIGAKCRIKKDAKIQTSVLMDGVEVGENSIVRNSILAENVTIEDNCLIEGALIAHDSVIRSGHKVADRARVWPNRKVRTDLHEGEMYGGEL